MKTNKSLMLIAIMATGCFLLFFFFIANYIANDKGIKVQVPDNNTVKVGPFTAIDSADILFIDIHKDNSVYINEQLYPLDSVERQVYLHLIGERDGYATSYDDAVINIRTHYDSDYKTYLDAYTAAKQAFTTLREQNAIDLYNQPLEELDKERANVVRKNFPLKIAEAQLK